MLEVALIFLSFNHLLHSIILCITNFILKTVYIIVSAYLKGKYKIVGLYKHFGINETYTPG